MYGQVNCWFFAVRFALFAEPCCLHLSFSPPRQACSMSETEYLAAPARPLRLPALHQSLSDELS